MAAGAFAVLMMVFMRGPPEYGKMPFLCNGVVYSNTILTPFYTIEKNSGDPCMRFAAVFAVSSPQKPEKRT